MKEKDKTLAYRILNRIFNASILVLPISGTGIVLGIPLSFELFLVAVIWAIWSMILGIIEIENIKSRESSD